MRECEANGTLIVEPGDALPDLRNAARLYLDFETTSLDTTRDSLNPWIKKHCNVLGIAITADNLPRAWYLPLCHYSPIDGSWRNGTLVDRWDEIAAWLHDVIMSAGSWVNHNVKYDAHVAFNCMCVDVLASPQLRLIDTLTRAKIFDSDMAYRGGYALDNLSARWLAHDITGLQLPMQPFLQEKFGRKLNRDYGIMPIDVVAPYAGQDVLTNRTLDRFLIANMPEESKGVCETEVKLTKILVDVERTGLTVDPEQIDNTRKLTTVVACAVVERLRDLTGWKDFQPHVNKDCEDLLCNHFGLPVLVYTDKDKSPEELEPGEEPGKASFNKHALKMYLDHLDVRQNPLLLEIVKRIIEFRKYNTKLNIFLNPYKEILSLTGENLIHSTYNQCVRTGRMSCGDPNAQQLDKSTKELIHAPDGWGLISTDASQIEFRTIVHYIADPRCIQAYLANPDTDFHEQVAQMCGMARGPAKTVNFMAGYGGGLRKTLKLLEASADVAEGIRKELGELEPGTLKDELKRRAAKFYEKYHDNLPTLKRTSREAERVCRNRGYVRNWYGRRRYLPRTHAHIAFNTINQSTAADIVKDRTVALHEAIQAAGLPIKIVAQVHDEILMIAPQELATNADLHRDIVRILEAPTRPLIVPIRWSIGGSIKHWREAGTAKKDGGPSTTLADVQTTQPVYLAV